jgi:integration host factor subunit alpha
VKKRGAEKNCLQSLGYAYGAHQRKGNFYMVQAAKQSSLTRSDLTAAVQDRLGLARVECSTLVDAVFETISEELVAGQGVKLTGFGSFSLRDKKARTGRNPRTKKEAVISPRRVVSFKTSSTLKERINSSHEG